MYAEGVNTLINKKVKGKFQQESDLHLKRMSLNVYAYILKMFALLRPGVRGFP